MNIFYLDNKPDLCAQYHVNKHCIKMIVEYAQILSTTHRVLDGKPINKISDSGRKKVVWELPNENMNTNLYAATHISHPSVKWVMQDKANYNWLFSLWEQLLSEYEYRYERVHASSRLFNHLINVPRRIPDTNGFSEPTPAMPSEYKVEGDSITSYHNYYNLDKRQLFGWKKRSTPYFIQNI